MSFQQGISGLNAASRNLEVIGNNIANATTVGYSRQDVTLAANAPRRVGTNYLGTGAVLSGVRRQYDAFVDLNLRSSNSDLKAQEPMVSYVNRLIDVMGDESIGLTTAMNQFFAAGRDLATDPASTVQRSTFLRNADGLASRFRELSTQVGSVDTETRDAITARIDGINTLAQQLATVNRKLGKHPLVERQPAPRPAGPARFAVDPAGQAGRHQCHDRDQRRRRRQHRQSQKQRRHCAG